MEHVQPADERRVLDVGFVDGPAGHPLVQHVGSHVEHPFAEAVTARGTTVVHDVRRKERDPSAHGPAMAGVQVIADRALVDDEHRPGVVRVWRVDVVDEPCVEDLVDAGHSRLPRANPLAWRGQDESIVQDLLEASDLDIEHGAPIEPRSPVNDLLALLGFAFVGTVSPGPNNAVLWGSGLRFGFGRTVPHVLGTALGIGAIAIGVAAGIGALLEAVPAAEVVLKVIGSAYLLYVAYLVAGSGGVGRTDVAHPLSVWQGVVFQFVNPKAWIFAIAAVGTFLPRSIPRLVAVGLLTGILMVVVIGSASIWAAGGAALGRVVEDERRHRAVSIVLAMLLVASVVLIWI